MSSLLDRLNEEARKLIADLGSSIVSNLGFRDNWIFVGGKGIKTKSPFEQVRYIQQQRLCSSAFRLKIFIQYACHLSLNY